MIAAILRAATLAAPLAAGQAAEAVLPGDLDALLETLPARLTRVARQLLK